MERLRYPDPFLEVRVEQLDLPFPSQSLCAGYEGGVWRASQLADHLFQWLPYAALNQEHQLSFGASNFVELLQLAATHVYNTRKTASRGELGELLFHLICVLHHGTFPVVCKLVLKTAPNDTVKGFDAVHLVPAGDGFDLWLGESKFYQNPRDAIREAVESVRSHVLPAFLSTEKAMILGHIPKTLPMYEKVLPLFRSQTSSDRLLAMSVFPILIAYESDTVGDHTELCDPYVEQLHREVADLKTYFTRRIDGMRLRFRLIFVPMGSKQAVIDRFDRKLEVFL